MFLKVESYLKVKQIHIIYNTYILLSWMEGLAVSDHVLMIGVCYNSFSFYLLLRKEMFYLTTHFIYGYMASDIWLRTILIVRKDTRCCHIGYSFRFTARVLLYAPSHRQDSIAHTTAFVTLVVEHYRSNP